MANMGKTFPIVELPKERILVVTGASSGLGYQITKWTAMMGATVIMACRSKEKTMEAIRQMNEEFRAEKEKGTQGLTSSDTLALEFMKVDLKSFKSVVEFCEAFKASGRKLHVLFCNAGVALGPFEKTADGFELCLQVNYLSQFLMTAKLLPIMKQSGPDCRILLMSSMGHRWGSFDLKTMNYDGPPDGYQNMEYYCRSKLYQIMQMYSMGERLAGSNITINSVHPGFVQTNLGNVNQRWFWRIPMNILHNLGVSKTPIDGARCSINCVVNPELAGTSGVYFGDFKVCQTISHARNKENQRQLWTETFRLVKEYLNEEEISAMGGP